MIYYEVCNLYEEHYNKYVLIGRLKASNFVYFGILHNKDYFPNGELKKPHFHLILGIEENNKIAKKKITDFFNDDSILVRNIRNPKGYARYLTHKDNLEKAQYNDNEVFTSDKNLYEELVTRDITMSNTDNLLNQFKDYVLSKEFDFNQSELFTFEWFSKKGKIDYYLKNERIIRSFIDKIISMYVYGDPNTFMWWFERYKPYLLEDDSFIDYMNSKKEKL